MTRSRCLFGVYALLLLLGAACGDSDETSSTEVGGGDCPTNGGDMKRLPEGFCIDRTEVTRANYFSWMETMPAVSEQTPECMANTEFLPTCLVTGGWGLDRHLENPVGCVDWCDAQTYCAAHGKRLCGGIGGGSAPLDAYADASKSEWYAACSSGGEYDYVFGDDYVLQACYETLRDTWGTTEAGSFKACVSPEAAYDGVFDLGGNVAEWENSCDGTDANARCRIRGGSFQHEGNGIRCDAGSTLTLPKTGSSDAVGFRCCAD